MNPPSEAVFVFSERSRDRWPRRRVVVTRRVIETVVAANGDLASARARSREACASPPGGRRLVPITCTLELEARHAMIGTVSRWACTGALGTVLMLAWWAASPAPAAVQD